MKITPTLLSVPPYISTTWKNIASLHLDREGVLHISLRTPASVVEIPHLSEGDIREIFDGHQLALEKREEILPFLSPFSFSLPLKGELIPPSLEHHPEQAGATPLPPPILKKILLVIKGFGLSDAMPWPKAEPHCNCLPCQLSRAVALEKGEEETEERVDESELTFRTWDIKGEGEKLYRVSNPLDPNEHYQVFLGEPLGCTCGEKTCEHIRAVLNEPC